MKETYQEKNLKKCWAYLILPNLLFACRFLTVDADIEHNESVMEFYQKNGFVPNAEMNGKRTKTISMRKGIYS